MGEFVREIARLLVYVYVYVYIYIYVYVYVSEETMFLKKKYPKKSNLEA